MDDVFGHQDGMGGPPGLDALGIEGEAGRNPVKFLGDENEFEGRSVHGLHTRVLGFDGGFHIGLEILADDIDHFAKPRLDGVMNGIVDDGFAMGAQTVHLLQAAITAAHTGCKNKKCRFHYH